MRRRHARGIVAVGMLLLVACNTETGSVPSATLAIGETVGSLDLNEDQAPTPPLPNPGENTIPASSPDITGLGSCNVDVTGDVTDSWTAEATDESVTYAGWLSDVALAEATANSVTVDPSYLVITCRGSGNRSISITNNGTLRQRAATVELTLDSSGTAPSERNQLRILLAVERDGVCTLAGEGSITIDAFDDAQIAGSFDAPFVCADGSAVRATGRFGFARPVSEPPPDPTITPTSAP